MTEQTQPEQKPKKRGRPPKHGAAMTGAQRQRRSVDERQSGVFTLLVASAMAMQNCPEAQTVFRNALSSPHNRAMAERGLASFPSDLAVVFRNILAVENT